MNRRTEQFCSPTTIVNIIRRHCISYLTFPLIRPIETNVLVPLTQLLVTLSSLSRVFKYKQTNTHSVDYVLQPSSDSVTLIFALTIIITIHTHNNINISIKSFCQMQYKLMNMYYVCEIYILISLDCGLLYLSIRVRTAPPVSVRVRVVFKGAQEC